jgi:site-specific recombinase XerC
MMDVKNSTRKKYLMAMRIFSDFLIYRGYIDVNHARECLKCPKVQKALPFSMDRDCYRQIYHAIVRRWGTGAI